MLIYDFQHAKFVIKTACTLCDIVRKGRATELLKYKNNEVIINEQITCFF